VEGFQVRLRAEKTSWKEGEAVALLADVRNGGEHELVFSDLSDMPFGVEVDGVEYASMGFRMAPHMAPHMTRLKAGEEKPGVAVPLSARLYKVKGRETLKLTPGEHRIRIWRAGFRADDAQKSVRAVSMELTIEITK
jgi:hypothetical protein